MMNCTNSASPSETYVLSVDISSQVDIGMAVLRLKPCQALTQLRLLALVWVQLLLDL